MSSPDFDAFLDGAIKKAEEVGQQRRDAAMQMHKDQMANQQQQLANQSQQIANQQKNAEAQNAFRQQELDSRNKQASDRLALDRQTRDNQQKQQQLQGILQLANALNGGARSYGGGGGGSYGGGSSNPRFSTDPKAQSMNVFQNAYAKEYERLNGLNGSNGQTMTPDQLHAGANSVATTARDNFMKAFPTQDSLSGEASNFGVSQSRVPGAGVQPQHIGMSPELRTQIEGAIKQHLDAFTGSSAPVMNTTQKLDAGIRNGTIKTYPGPNSVVPPSHGSAAPIQQPSVRPSPVSQPATQAAVTPPPAQQSAQPIAAPQNSVFDNARNNLAYHAKNIGDAVSPAMNALGRGISGLVFGRKPSVSSNVY